MIKIIWTKGLPASGKSTWAREWVNEKASNRIRVNRDDIRNMLGPYWIPSRESLVTEIENSMVINAVEKNYDVVIDATNFRGIGRFENLEVDGIPLRSKEDVVFKCKDFSDVDLETCIQRDRDRKEGHVSKEVIMRMHNKYLK